MNKKYNGKLIQITGRTSGVTGEGILILKLTTFPFEDIIKCYGIRDDFLFSVKKGDIVSITGTYERKGYKGLSGRKDELTDCFGWKKVQ